MPHSHKRAREIHAYKPWTPRCSY